MAYGFKTGGRTAGTLNKRTEAMLEEIASTGETPLQYMLRMMRDPEAHRLAGMPWLWRRRHTFIPSCPKSMALRTTNKLSPA